MITDKDGQRRQLEASTIMTALPINEIQVGLFELDLKGSFAYDEDEIRTLLRFMEKGLITTEGMLNKTFKLEEAQIALEGLSKTTESP